VRKSHDHTSEGQLFPTFYFISAAVLKVTFSENRIAISAITSSSEIYLDEMVVIPGYFSEYSVHKKWKSHCCVSGLESHNWFAEISYR